MAKKSCILVLLMLFCTLAVQAKPVDAVRARQVAANHLRVNALYDKSKPEPVLTDVTSLTPFTEFYVFAVNGNKGFVLVSADDCVRPILGYSVNSEFRTENIPAHVLAWLQGYEREIRAAREQGIVATGRISAEWNRLDAGRRPQRDLIPVVDGLTSTIWNQSPYYNNLCPYDSQAGENAVTGCVATAMGQLMKYWNHPTHGTGSHSYSCVDNDYGTLSANFAATTYDWANMPDYLTSFSSAAELNAVATLLYHCGVAVEMEYSASGSGASTIGTVGATCETALKNYFKYSSMLHGEYKYDFTDAAWKQMVMAELDAARPLIYRGQGESGGHCFICDGYDSDTNFRFNWGWSGYYNAFYPLSAMDPTTSMSFTDYQGAIFGIVPNGVGLAPLNISITNTLPTSVTIAWSDPNAVAADNFIIAYGLASTFDTANSATYSTINTTNLQYVIQGLTTYTQYKVAIRSNCGGTLSPWTAPVSFTTAAPAQPLPITANFEGTMPTYWQQEYVSGNTDWDFTAQGGYLNYPNGALSGSYNARFFQDGYGSITRLITPIINMVGDAQMEYSGSAIGKLIFGHAQIPWQEDQDELRVYYRSTPTDSWTLLTSYTTEINWRRDTLILPNISGNYQVAFEATANYGYGVCLDDVRIFTEAITGNYATAPYACDFSDTAESNAWMIVNGTETNKWYIGTGTFSGVNDVYSLYISSDNGMSNYYTTTAPSVVFAYRDITLSAGQYAYSYDWLSDGESGRDYMRVALVPENVSMTAGLLGQWSETTLPVGALAMDGGSYLSGQSSWQTANDVIDIPSTGNYRIVVMWNNDDRYGYQPPAAIDNISLVQNNCVLPTNLMVSNVTSNGAQLLWTPGASETQWSVTIGGSTYTTNTSSYTITGLQPNAEYTVEVRSVCGNASSLAPRRITFRTECGSVQLPYFCGFEDAPVGAGSAMPDCWHRISSNNFPYVVQSNAHSGGRSLYFHTGYTQYAVLPSVDAPLNTLSIQLWARTAAVTSTSLEVGMMSDPNDATTFVPVATLDNLTPTYTLYNVSFENYTGTGAYPALKVAAGNMNYIYVDDISLTACTYSVTSSAPFIETFESNSSTLECWSQEYGVGNVDWTYVAGGYNGHPSGAHSGSLNARFYINANGQHTTRLISPTFATSTLPAIKFSFWHAQPVWSSDQDRLTVYYRTSVTAPWTQLEQFTNSITSWTYHEYYLPASDSLQVSFLGDARYGYGVVLDDVTIEEAPFCGEVTNLTAVVSDTASATVHLSWNGSLSSGGYFRILYGEHGFDPASGQGTVINNITSTNYSIAYLPVNINYDFYVTTICNSQQQSNDVMVSAYVPSAPVRTFPYSCSFSDPADNNQWNLENGTQTNQWCIGTAAGNEGSDPHALYISNTGGTSNQYTGYTSYVYAYRDMVMPVGSYDYSFDWRCNGESTYDYLRVALVPENVALTAGSYTGWSTTAVPTGAIALDGGSRLNEQTAWQPNNQGSFTITQAGTYRLVFFWRNDGSVNNQPPAAIDNIVIQQNACGTVSDPVAVGTDTNTIQLSWTGVLSNGATYSVEYGPAGFTRGTGAIINNITATQTTITNLATNTIYDFYVSISCPTQILTAYVLTSGRTLTRPIALPYQTSFDNIQDNNMWVLLNDGQPNKWVVGDAMGEGDYHSLYISNDNGVSNTYSTENASIVFAYRPVNLDVDSFAYSYSWRNYGENNYDYLRVALVPASTPLTAGAASGFGYSTSMPAGSIILDGGSQLTQQGSWQQQSGIINITQAGTYNLVFFWRNDAYMGTQPPAAIDNIVFRRDNCHMPSNVIATRVDSNSVTLTWDNVAGTSWRVGYGNSYDTVQVNSATITGLTPSTDYNLNVMTICEVGSSVPTIVTVRTLCSPMRLPYSYDFEDATGSGASHTINPCWRWGNDHPNATSNAYPYNYSHTGWYAWFTNTTSSTGTYLVVPAVAHPMNQLELSFWARRTQTGSSYHGDLEIGVVDNPYNFSSFHKIADIEVESTSWNQYFAYTDNYQGSEGFLCIRAPYRTSGYNDIYIDDIIVDTLPDCSEPVNILTSVTDTTAHLTWHGIGHNVRWGVEYGLHDFILGSGTFAYTTDTNFTITGLQRSTQYDVYIYTDCHHTSSEAAMVTFTTACGQESVPYFENFDSYEASQTGTIDPCWYKKYSYNNSTTSYPYISTSQSQYAGSKALYFSSGSNYYSYAALPEFDQPINTLQMTLKVNKTMGYNVQVGYMTDPTNFSTFHSVSTISPTQSYSWETFTVSFSTVSSTVSHPHMAIVAPQGTAGNVIMVDDVEVDFIPPCNAPTNLTVSNITASSATLQWNASAGVTHYRIEIGVDGFSEGSGSIIDSIAGTSYTLTGLQPGYTYNVYVSSICQNGLGYSASANTSFTTNCGLAAVPYTENFDTYQTSQSAQISPCWHKGYGTSDSQYGYPYPNAANAQYPGSLSLYFYGYNTNYSYAALPLFADSIQNLQLTFKVYNESNAVVSIGYLTAQSNYNSFQQVASITPTAGSWETYTIPFNNVTGTNRYMCIAARGNTTNNRFYIDDVTVERIPNCPSVASVSIDSITDTRAVISWPAVSGVTQYQVEYGLVGYPAGFGTVIDNITSTSVALSNLTPSTNYSVSVRAKCSENNLGAATSIIFTTPCVLETVPYSYGFESWTSTGGNQPIHPCWTQLTNSTSTIYPTVTTASSYQGQASLIFMSNSNTYSCAVLPMFADSVQNLQLSFYARRQQTNGGTIVVGVISDLNNYSSFRPVQTFQTDENWQQYTTTFDTCTGQQLWMAIAMPVSSQGGSRNVYVDNIEVNYHQPYCLHLTIADSTRGSVQVSGNATADGRFWPGTSVTLTATPNPGYAFGHWAVGTSANPYTFTMPSHDVYYNNIVFNKVQYNISAVPSVIAGGYVTGTGYYNYLDTAILTANPNPGYYFTNWSDGSTDNPRSIVVTSDSSFIANFLWGCPDVYQSDTIEACDQYTWDATGDTYTMGGMYLHSYTNQSLCDIVDTLYLTINQSYSHSVADTACDQYAWRGHTYTASGLYVDSLTTVHNCDSVYTLALTLGHNSSHTDVQFACDSLVWHGTTYVENTNTQTFTITNAAGCDSVVTLNLTLGHSNSTTFTQNACNGYAWHGQYYLASGTYSYTATNVSGCDSTEILQLTINHNVSTDFSETACDSYTWMGQTYTQTGNYTNHLQTTAGCDSSVTIHLTINYSTQYTDVQTGCDSYTWHDSTYTVSTNTSTYTTTNAIGCDSVVTLKLILGHSNSYADMQTACDNYIWHGNTYTASTNTPTYTTTNASGCDSVVTLNLTLNHSSSSTESHTACDSYTWHGISYTQSGTYTDTLTNALGCDSVTTLQLTINQSATVDIADTACDTYTWFGTAYTQSGNYNYHIPTAAGCDSSMNLHLVINRSAATSDIQTACDSYTWIDGNTYTASTSSPAVTLTTVNGCDSVVTLNLTLGHSNGTSESRAACESYTWHGSTYTQSGTYTDTLTNVSGCDSVTTLQLTINHNATVDIVDTACDSYTWFGTSYTQSGNYSFRIPTAAGCDSNLVLHLMVYRSATSTDIQSACDSYTWIDGNTYTASTSSPAVTLTTVDGCDSVVTLNLTLGHSSAYTDVQHACDSYVWHDSTYTASTSTPTYTTTNVSGCNSVTTLHLTISNSAFDQFSQTVCDAYNWLGQSLTQTGDYVDSNFTVAGCDSITVLHLVVNHSSYRYVTDTACDSYTWPVNGQIYTAGGTYTYNNTTLAGCDSIIALGLVINHSYQAALADTACDSYSWHGVSYTHSNHYTFDSVTAEGCNYHETLDLVVNQGTHQVNYQQYCDDFFWHGQSYDESGTYTYGYINAEGCPSTDTLHLTIDHHSDTAYYAIACDNYTWNGTTYTESGVYTYDHSQFTGTCINVDTLYLTIHNSALYLESLAPCDSFLWNGNLYTVDGTYFLDTVTSFGCDSTVQLNLTFRHATFHTETVEVCDGYTWDADSNYYYRSGTYTYQATNAEGCDSNMTLLLAVHPSYTYGFEPGIIRACDSYEWNGRTYTESGYYIDSLQTIFGCDSIVNLSLLVNHGYYRTDVVTECDSYTWIDGITYTGTPATMPVIAGTTAEGCDSIITLDLTLGHSGSYTLTEVACDAFFWQEQTLTESGSYVDTLANAEGCDSIVTLMLTVNHSIHMNMADTACDSYTWHGNRYTESGSYTDTLAGAAGCDSIVMLTLVVNHSQQLDFADTACDSYTWHGHDYLHSGTYTFDSVTAEGCSHKETLALVVNRGKFDAEYRQYCDTFTWHGQQYAESGTYTYDYVSVEGCPSTDTLYLTIDNHGDTAFYASACDSYSWNGTAFTESGTYTYDYSQLGSACTNVDTLYLTIHRSAVMIDSLVACDSLTWHGILYTESIVDYFDTLTMFGCDSTTQLQLTINYSTMRIDTVEACNSYTWAADGLSYTQSGVYTFDTLNAAGCDSSMTLLLTIATGVDTAYYVNACDVYSWNDSLYTESGTYLYDHSFEGGICNNVDTLYLTINYSNSGIDSITACDSYTWIDGQTYTQSIEGQQYTVANIGGCDSVVTLVLTVNYNTSAAYYDTINQGETYQWNRNGEDYVSEGTYTYDYLTDAGCASTDTLYLTVIPPHDTVYYTVRGQVNDTNMGYVVIYPDTVIAEYQAAYVIAVPHEGYIFQQWQDGDTHMVRIVWVESDTTMTATFEVNLGISAVELVSYTIWADRLAIHVQGTGLIGRQVLVYDVTGRRFAAVTAHDEQLVIPTDQWPTGVYFVKVDNAPAQRVVLHR